MKKKVKCSMGCLFKYKFNPRTSFKLYYCTVRSLLHINASGHKQCVCTSLLGHILNYFHIRKKKNTSLHKCGCFQPLLYTVKKSFAKFRCGQWWREPNDVGVGKFLLPRCLVLRHRCPHRNLAHSDKAFFTVYCLHSPHKNDSHPILVLSAHNYIDLSVFCRKSGPNISLKYCIFSHLFHQNILTERWLFTTTRKYSSHSVSLRSVSQFIYIFARKLIF